MKTQNDRTQEWVQKNQISNTISKRSLFRFNLGFALWLMAGTLILAMNSMALTNGASTNDTSARVAGDANEMWDNENPDATSKWGSNLPSRFKQLNEQRIPDLQPISSTSFNTISEAGPSRSIASVVDEEGNAAPRAAVQGASWAAPSRALTRSISKQKSFQEVAVIVNDLGFFPSTIFLTQGVPVRLFITGASKRSQCFMMESFAVRKQIQTGKIEEITFMPDSSGTFQFSCPMSGAKGTMLVKSTEGERFPASVQTGRNPAVSAAVPVTLQENQQGQ